MSEEAVVTKRFTVMTEDGLHRIQAETWSVSIDGLVFRSSGTVIAWFTSFRWFKYHFGGE